MLLNFVFNGKQYCQKQVHFLENNKIEILFSNYMFGLTFQGPSPKDFEDGLWKVSPNI